jgi:hypothetical protein
VRRMVAGPAQARDEIVRERLKVALGLARPYGFQVGAAVQSRIGDFQSGSVTRWTCSPATSVTGANALVTERRAPGRLLEAVAAARRTHRAGFRCFRPACGGLLAPITSSRERVANVRRARRPSLAAALP